MDRMGGGFVGPATSHPSKKVFSPKKCIPLESELMRVEPYLTRAHYTVLRQGSMLHAAHIPGWLVSGS